MRTRIRTALALLAALLIFVPLASFAQSGYDLFQKALTAERAEGKLNDAIALYQRIVREFSSDRALVAKALVQMGQCYEKQGKAEARKAYERVLREFADQPEAAEARTRLAVLIAAAKPAAGAGIVVRQVWTGTGEASAISPDGRYLAHVGDEGGVSIRDLLTGDDRRITVSGSDRPTFSPDGKSIAYRCIRCAKGGRDELHLIALDGSAPRILNVSYEGSVLFPAMWSSDGKHILGGAQSLNGDRQLVWISLADGSVRVLKTLAEWGGPPWGGSLSPDGRYFVYAFPARKDSNKRDIFIFSTDGGGEVPLVTQTVNNHSPIWTPDGGGIVFLSDREGSTGAWFLRVVDGKPQGAPELVKRDVGRVVPMGFTRNGSLYYKEWSAMPELYTATLDPTTGTITGQPASVTQRLVTQNGEVWSPNGQYLAYSSRRSSAQGEVDVRIIVIRSVQTGEEYELAPALRAFDLQDWSPDSRSLLVTAIDKDGRRGAYRVDARTGDVALLATTGSAFDTANWFANGKSIVFGRNDGPGGSQIVERDLETGHEIEWYRAPASLNLYYVEAAADGRHLAFILRDPEMKVAGASLMVMTAAGEKPRKLDLRLKGSDEVDSILGFTPDSRQVLFNSFDPKQKERGYKYWRIAVEGGADPQEIRLKLDRPVYIEQMSFHPDGQRIAFTGVSLRSSSKSVVWVMENFLPVPTLTLPASTVLARRVTDEGTVDQLGTPSPDGRFLSTTDWATGDLAIIDTVTGQKRLVTNKGSWTQSSQFAMFSAVSPDGKRIAYGWFNKEEKFDLRVVDVDGTSPRVLSASEEVSFFWPAAWTPDGNSILAVLARSDRSSQIALISAADGTVRALKTLARGNATFKVSLSPDGRYIAYDYLAKEDAPEHDIFLLPIEGGREVPLVRHAADDLFPIWTPDGQNVVFLSDRTGNLGLWRIRVVNGKPQGPEELLKQDVGRVMPIGFSSKGSYYYGLDLGLVDVYLTTLDLAAGKVAAAPAPISQRYIGDRDSPHWSPDGKFLLYVSRRGPFPPAMGSRTLSIFSTETGREREITLNVENVRRPRWSPDAREILVNAFDAQGRQGLFRADAHTGEATLVALTEPDISFAWGTWSRDGKSVLFFRTDNKKRTSALVQRDLQTGEEKEVYHTSPPLSMNGFELAPDGQQVVLHLLDRTTSTGTLKTVPLAGGEPRDLLQVQGPNRIMGSTRPVWTPNGKDILFLRLVQQVQQPPTSPSVTELWRVSVETGKAEKLGLAMEFMRDITLHPDGKHLAFAAGQTKTEIWVMENLLPAPPRAAK